MTPHSTLASRGLIQLTPVGKTFYCTAVYRYQKIVIVNIISYYIADFDQDRAHPTGGRECVGNLGKEGTEPWNKWYTGAVYSGQTHVQATITVQLTEPSRIDRYSLSSANDCPGRNPRTWELWGKRPGAALHEWVKLHEYEAIETFEPSSTLTFDLDPQFSQRDNVFSELQLHVLKNQGAMDGIQLRNFLLFSRIIGPTEASEEDALSTKDIEDEENAVWRPESRQSVSARAKPVGFVRALSSDGVTITKDVPSKNSKTKTSWVPKIFKKS
jgi:hypothetical protein